MGAGKSFIVGNEITLADLEMFFPLRFYMQLVFTEEIRKMFPNVTAWFSKLMVNPHIIKSYGRTVLCQVAAKLQKMKLVGYKYSATCQRIMAVARFANAQVEMENVKWGAPEREQLKKKTITGTFPYLETSNGILSEAYAIVQYLADEKLNGSNNTEESQVNQWVQFAQNEITRYNKDLIYPLLGFTEHNSAVASKANKEVVQWIKVLDAHLAGKSFIVGNEITLADLEMFFPLRFYMQLVFTEEIRKMFPNVTAWFSKLMVNPHIIKSYGRTVLCKVAQVAPKLAPRMKLIGYKYSGTVQRIMAVAKYANAPVVLESVNWGAPEREQLKNNTKTGTFPYLETPNGTISESYAIIKYILNNFCPNMWEKPLSKNLKSTNG